MVTSLFVFAEETIEFKNTKTKYYEPKPTGVCFESSVDKYQLKERHSISWIMNYFELRPLFCKGCSVEMTQTLNQIKDIDFVEPGQILILPKKCDQFSWNDPTDYSVVRKDRVNDSIATEIMNRRNGNKSLEKEVDTETSLGPQHVNNPTSDPTEISHNEKTPTTSYFIMGVGTFIANNTEKDRQTETNTMTGLQPLIYGQFLWDLNTLGNLNFEIYGKQIVSTEYSFPMNYDFRVQYTPRLFIFDQVSLFITHSIIKTSYVGKNSIDEIVYTLSQNNIGMGLRYKMDSDEFNVILEKAYTAKTESSESSHESTDSYRFDIQYKYNLNTDWKISPAISYLKFKKSSSEYDYTGLEGRLSIERQFEF